MTSSQGVLLLGESYFPLIPCYLLLFTVADMYSARHCVCRLVVVDHDDMGTVALIFFFVCMRTCCSSSLLCSSFLFLLISFCRSSFFSHSPSRSSSCWRSRRTSNSRQQTTESHYRSLYCPSSTVVTPASCDVSHRSATGLGREVTFRINPPPPTPLSLLPTHTLPERWLQGSQRLGWQPGTEPQVPECLWR